MESSIWKKSFTLDDLNDRIKVKIMEYVDFTFVEKGKDFISAKIVVDERTHQPYKILHGGAICLLAENLGSIAAYYCTEGIEDFAFGMNLNASYFRPTFKGHVTAIAKPKHLGKTTQVWNIEVKNDENKLVSQVMFTVAIKNIAKSDHYPIKV